MTASASPAFVPLADNLLATRRTIYVNRKATSGDGSAGSPWAGWDGVITNWPTDGPTFRFPAGHYWYANDLSPHVHNVALLGEPGTWLHYNGTGRAVSLDARAFGGNGYSFKNPVMRSFNIDGGTNNLMTTGVYLDSIFDGRFEDISVNGFTQAHTNTFGFNFQFCIALAFDRMISRGNLLAPTDTAHMPAIGMLLGDTVVADPNNPPALCACTFSNCDVEFSRIFGLWAKNGFNCVFNGGTFSTTKNGQDLQTESLFVNSVFNAVDFEGQTGTSRIVLNTGAGAGGLQFNACDGNSNLIINGAGNPRHRFIGGRGYGTYTDNSLGGNRFEGLSDLVPANVAGAGAPFNAYILPGGTFQLPLITITGGAGGGVNYLYLHDATTAGQATYTRYRSERTGHVKEWNTGIGIAGFNSYVIYDATTGIVPFQVNEDDSLSLTADAGVSVKNLRVTGGFTNTAGFGSQVSVTDPATCDFDLFVNNAAGGAGYVQWRSNKTAANKTWWMGIGIVSGNSLVVYDNQTGIVPFKISETDDVVIAGAATNKVGFYGGGGAVKPTITGSRGANAALASLLTALAGQGLITDSTT